MLFSVVDPGSLNIDLLQNGTPINVTKDIVIGEVTYLSTVPINTNADLRVDWTNPNSILFQVHQDVVGASSTAESTLYATQIAPIVRMEYEITGNLPLTIQGDANGDSIIEVAEIFSIGHQTTSLVPGTYDGTSQISFSAVIPEPMSVVLLVLGVISTFLFGRLFRRASR